MKKEKIIETDNSLLVEERLDYLVDEIRDWDKVCTTQLLENITELKSTEAGRKRMEFIDMESLPTEEIDDRIDTSVPVWCKDFLGNCLVGNKLSVQTEKDLLKEVVEKRVSYLVNAIENWDKVSARELLANYTELESTEEGRIERQNIDTGSLPTEEIDDRIDTSWPVWCKDKSGDCLVGNDFIIQTEEEILKDQEGYNLNGRRNFQRSRRRD